MHQPPPPPPPPVPLPPAEELGPPPGPFEPRPLAPELEEHVRRSNLPLALEADLRIDRARAEARAADEELTKSTLAFYLADVGAIQLMLTSERLAVRVATVAERLAEYEEDVEALRKARASAGRGFKRPVFNPR
jgi:hypothetical protein